MCGQRENKKFLVSIKYMQDMVYVKLQHFLPLLSSQFLSLAVVMVITVWLSLVRVGHKT